MEEQITIESKLEKLSGTLLSIERDTVNGWYVITIGLPLSWVFNDNESISCEIIDESDKGRLIKIAPKRNDKNVIIDDLIRFVEIIIDTNGRIAEKEKEFTKRMEEMKGLLEKEAKHFYQELDELKENSFNNISKSFSTITPIKKKTKGRPKKNETITEPVIEATHEQK